MTITLLGTGTSQGVPVIGCACDVCQSADPRDKRLRTAALLQVDGKNIAIDCGPDFRAQMLRAGVDHLDAILITHQHNDHIIGLDDVRPFNFKSHTDMPVYCTKPVQAELNKRFAYIFATQNRYPGAPMVKLETISKKRAFELAGINVLPIEAMHGRMPVLGFRIGGFAYMTDVKTIAEAERAKLQGLHTLVLSALHKRPHHSHLNLEEALAMIETLQPKQTYLTHLSHSMGKYEEIERELPEGVNIGYDQLRIEVPSPIIQSTPPRN
ncbi:MAG: MBL fold metallo-hydrolase [Bacteroidetes bacterium]|nr:MBL fold metallo-hydrolase [Bacteroidota bacterium]